MASHKEVKQVNQFALARAKVKNFRFRQNKTESRLIHILDEYLPGKYIWNGGQITIEGMVPDCFCINEAKAILEIIGRTDVPKHSPEALKKRAETFKKYGFRTLYIYMRDFQDEDQLLKDIIFFTHFGFGKEA